MKKTYIKSLGSILVIGAFLFLALGSEDNNSSDESTSISEEAEQEKIPTNFATCEDLIDYARNKSYDDLKSEWGEGSIGEPWFTRQDVGEMGVIVEWNNIQFSGKNVKIQFEYNGFDPTYFHGVRCNE